MIALLRDLDFSPKDVERRGNFIVYFKKSAAIEDMLTTMGAQTAALAVMSTTVDKDMNNAVQRAVNCDLANTDKSVAASAVQLAAIRQIEANAGLKRLPEKLHQTALLRLMNPEASLAELAELAIPAVSKSCMRYRLNQLVERAGQTSP